MATLQPLQTHESILSEFSPEEQELLRPAPSNAIGLEVVVKFHKNQIQNQRKRNPFVSWTLNKVAVVDRDWLRAHRTSLADGEDGYPILDRDWWRVKIENETSSGQAMGCFVVRPLWKVEREELAILAPTTYDTIQRGLTILIYPRLKPWLHWVAPKGIRKAVMRKTGGAAFVIPLSYPPEGQPRTEINDGLPSYLLGPQPEDDFDFLD